MVSNILSIIKTDLCIVCIYTSNTLSIIQNSQFLDLGIEKIGFKVKNRTVFPRSHVHYFKVCRLNIYVHKIYLQEKNIKQKHHFVTKIECVHYKNWTYIRRFREKKNTQIYMPYFISQVSDPDPCVNIRIHKSKHQFLFAYLLIV